MANELNCSQFTIPYPDPGISGALNLPVPWFITLTVIAYKPYHYYLLTSIVAFSFFANIFIVIVLSQKEMRTSGINVTMLLIAVCDFGCSITGLTQLFLRIYSVEEHISYLIAYSQITVDYLAVAFHASSLYLAVGMAFCRVMALQFSSKKRIEWQSPKYALYMASILCSLTFVTATFVIFVNEIDESEKDGVFLVVSNLSMAHECLFMRISLIASGLGFKIAPCILMLIFSLILLRRMDEGKVSSNNATTQNRNINE